MSAPKKGSEFSLDTTRRILKFKLWGLWDEEHLKTFQEGVKANLAQLGPGPFAVYVDIIEYPPQHPNISKGAQEMMALAVRTGMRKAAHLVNKNMTELQVKRLADEIGAQNFRFFRTEKEAMDWLLEK